MLFADASALVKRYVRERHTAQVRRLVGTGPVAISRLSEVEVPSALARLVRQGHLAERRRDRAVSAFVADVAVWYVVEVTPVVTDLARTLLRQYDLRAADAVQLASAIRVRQSVPAVSLIAFDARLIAAAEAEQLPVLPGGRPHSRSRRTST